MTPTPSIKYHPTFEMLLDYASAGCPIDCGPDWSIEHITATIKCSPHLSTKNPAAAASIWVKTLEKVAQGYAQMVKWDNGTISKQIHPKNSKFYPLQPCHKSCLLCTILDLLFKLHLHGQCMASVNENTTPQSNHKAMEQLGKVLW